MSFDGDAVEVRARDHLSKSGRVSLHEALAQLSAELASAEPGLAGWEAELSWSEEAKAVVVLSPEGRIQPAP